jgi:universal stress protein A
MIALKNVLVATDLSECSQAAVEEAAALARSFDARLSVLYVVTEPLRETWACYAPGADFIDAVNALEARARAKLETVLAAEKRAGLLVMIATTWGDPSDEILAYARVSRADLIVCGTHGRRGWQHMVMGSVAERLVRLALCPVLTVPPLRRVVAAAA